MMNLWFLWRVIAQTLCCQWGLQTKFSSKGTLKQKWTNWTNSAALGTLKQKCCKPVALVQSLFGGTRAVGTHSSQSPSVCSTDGAEPLLPVDRIVCLFQDGLPLLQAHGIVHMGRWMGGTMQVGIATSGSVLWGLCNHKQVEKVGKGISLLSQPRQQLLHILGN